MIRKLRKKMWLEMEVLMTTFLLLNYGCLKKSMKK